MFSPEREPFKSWKKLPTFWARMVEVPLELYLRGIITPGYGQSPDGVFGAMIDSRQVHKLPVGLAVVAAGRLSGGHRAVRSVCGSRKSTGQMLTWITFPCYVGCSPRLIYFIGYKLRAGESECNELQVVDVLPQRRTAPSCAGAPTLPSTRRSTPSIRSTASRNSRRCAANFWRHAAAGTAGPTVLQRATISKPSFRAGLDQPALSERLVAVGRITADGYDQVSVGRLGVDSAESQRQGHFRGATGHGDHVIETWERFRPDGEAKPFRCKAARQDPLESFVNNNARRYRRPSSSDVNSLGRRGSGRIR